MSDSISIAFINNFAGPSLGGGEVQLLELLGGLRRAGVEVSVFCAKDSALEQSACSMEGVRVIPLDFKLGSMSSLVATIGAQLGGARIVQGTGFFTNILARQVRGVAKVAVINTVHVVPGAATLDGETRASSMARKLLDRSSRKRVDVFIAVSRAVADGLVSDKVDRRKIVVIPNGFDLESLRLRAAEPLSIELPTGHLVGYVGRLERVKGCEYFLRAAAMLAQDRPDVAFVVAGAGSLRDQLEALTGELGIGDRVSFLGHVDQAPALLAALDVVVVPSLSEASGFTAAEALALGVSVVATDVGGLPETVADGETGLLVPPADPAAIVAAVARLLDDPDLATRLVASGKQRASESFSAERMVEGYLDVCKKLVS